MNNLKDLKDSNNAPQWLTEQGYTTLKGGYLLQGETPKDGWQRAANAAARALNKPELATKFFDYMWKGWLCLSTPALSNLGTERGLPISCNSIHVDDSVDSIYNKQHELAMLSKHGAGVGVYFGDVRGRGANIAGNGKSEGIVSWLKCYDSTTMAVSQGNVRRGATAIYLPVTHKDIKEFLLIKRPQGDPNRHCLNLHQAVVVPDTFMQMVKDGDPLARELWTEVCRNRLETGEPYILFEDNVNKANPKCYKDLGLTVSTSNLCCVAAETKILTDNGHLEISTLVNSLVKVWDGAQFSEVMVKETGIAPLFKVELSDGTDLIVTDNHKFPVKNDYHKREELVPLKDMKIGDKVAKYEMPVIAFPDKNDPKIDGYSQGFYSAEGNTDYTWSWVYEPKKECSARLIGSISDTLAYGRRRWNHGKMLDKAYVPFEASINYKLNWIAGVLDGDSVVVFNKKDGIGNTIQLASIDRDFLLNIKLMLTTLGINSKVRAMHKNLAMRLMPDGKGGQKEYLCKPCYRLLLNGPEILKFQELGIKFNRLKFHGKPTRSSAHLPRVLSIEATGRTEMTYCFNNPNNGLGTFNGVVTGNSEIMLHTDKDHSFVCCLSSVNLTRWDEWKDTDLVQTSIWFLDGVLTEYIDKAKYKPGFNCSVASAVKGRAVGLGVLGWHSLLQSKEIAFESFQAMMLNRTIFSHIKTEAEKATVSLADAYGCPEWCYGQGRRNTHLLAVAPTVSNSIISGNVSAGIEPLPGNAYSKKTAKGVFIEKNPYLKVLLEGLNKDLSEVWSSIVLKDGSVQHLEFLSDKQKEVYKTAYEIDQSVIIQQAAQRQQFIDQGQSLNLFFPKNTSASNFHKVHMLAWELGVKALYYVRSDSVLKADTSSRGEDISCLSCDG